MLITQMTRVPTTYALMLHNIDRIRVSTKYALKAHYNKIFSNMFIEMTDKYLALNSYTLLPANCVMSFGQTDQKNKLL